MTGVWQVVAAVVPSIGVGLLFWYAIRALLNADRTERAAIARMDAQESAAALAAARAATIPGSGRADSQS